MERKRQETGEQASPQAGGYVVGAEPRPQAKRGHPCHPERAKRVTGQGRSAAKSAGGAASSGDPERGARALRGGRPRAAKRPAGAAKRRKARRGGDCGRPARKTRRAALAAERSESLVVDDLTRSSPPTSGLRSRAHRHIKQHIAPSSSTARHEWRDRAPDMRAINRHIAPMCRCAAPFLAIRAISQQGCAN